MKQLITLLFQSQCISTPCQNGGTCLANYQDDTFTCLCQNDYIGQHCEKGNDLKWKMFLLFTYAVLNLGQTYYHNTIQVFVFVP